MKNLSNKTRVVNCTFNLLLIISLLFLQIAPAVYASAPNVQSYDQKIISVEEILVIQNIDSQKTSTFLEIIVYFCHSVPF